MVHCGLGITGLWPYGPTHAICMKVAISPIATALAPWRFVVIYHVLLAAGMLWPPYYYGIAKIGSSKNNVNYDSHHILDSYQYSHRKRWIIIINHIIDGGRVTNWLWCLSYRSIVCMIGICMGESGINVIIEICHQNSHWWSYYISTVPFPWESLVRSWRPVIFGGKYDLKIRRYLIEGQTECKRKNSMYNCMGAWSVFAMVCFSLKRNESNVYQLNFHYLVVDADRVKYHELIASIHFLLNARSRQCQIMTFPDHDNPRSMTMPLACSFDTELDTNHSHRQTNKAIYFVITDIDTLQSGCPVYVKHICWNPYQVFIQLIGHFLYKNTSVVNVDKCDMILYRWLNNL